MWSWQAFLDFLTSPALLRGAWTTVWLTVVTMAAGLVLGLGLAVMRSSRVSLARRAAGAYIWLFRGTPLLVQLVIIYTGLPQVGIKLGALTSALLGLALNEAAYLSEIVRAGILSVPKGQVEAARALGMQPAKVMRVVVLPQAFRVMVPPLGNSFNGLLKTTTLVSVIAVEELLRLTQYEVQSNFRVLEGLVAAALYYLLLTTLWQLCQSRIEKVVNRSHGPVASATRSRGTEALRPDAIGSEVR
jgi:polar amino acid transport system permease protein